MLCLKLLPTKSAHAYRCFTPVAKPCVIPLIEVRMARYPAIRLNEPNNLPMFTVNCLMDAFNFPIGIFKSALPKLDMAMLPAERVALLVFTDALKLFMLTDAPCRFMFRFWILLVVSSTPFGNSAVGFSPPCAGDTAGVFAALFAARFISRIFAPTPLMPLAASLIFSKATAIFCKPSTALADSPKASPNLAIAPAIERMPEDAAFNPSAAAAMALSEVATGFRLPAASPAFARFDRASARFFTPAVDVLLFWTISSSSVSNFGISFLPSGFLCPLLCHHALHGGFGLLLLLLHLRPCFCFTKREDLEGFFYIACGLRALLAEGIPYRCGYCVVDVRALEPIAAVLFLPALYIGFAVVLRQPRVSTPKLLISHAVDPHVGGACLFKDLCICLPV